MEAAPTTRTVKELLTAAQRWIDADPDPACQSELRGLVAQAAAKDQHALAELAGRFAQRLAFGTAGLRGPLRAGPNGMNRATVRAAAAGLVSYLDSKSLAGSIVIGYDARHGSAAFAEETARVVTGAGRQALLLPRPLPTPVLAYAIRVVGAAAGVMVTASHNPAADNGYKVYLGDGAQIAPPTDIEISTEIDRVYEWVTLAKVPLGDSGMRLGEELICSYVDDVATLTAPGPRDIPTVYTPLHGVGCEVFLQTALQAGFAEPALVAAQRDPDPDFPTTPFPNPEEPGALRLAIETATRLKAELIIAHDPDADRCAVALPATPDRASWRRLSGDEVGILLADHLMNKGVAGVYATTIVSSRMLRALCTRRGPTYAETLTGFKWLMRSVEPNALAFGYEEALGYAVAPQLVRDKDGISAALQVMELAAELRAAGQTLFDRLDELALTHGVFRTRQLSFRFTDPTAIEETMDRLRADPPRELRGKPITNYDDFATHPLPGSPGQLPRSDVLVFTARGLRAVLRPSGTEPKLKLYLEASEPAPANQGELNQARLTLDERLRELGLELAQRWPMGAA